MLDAGSFTAQTRKRFFWANFVISAAPPAEDYMVLEYQLDIDLDLMHSLALPEQRVRSLHKKVDLQVNRKTEIPSVSEA